MDCYKLNEAVYRKIENVLDVPKREIPQLEPAYYKSIYGPGTLINDWYEKRTGTQTQQAQPEPYLSENMDQYREFCTGSVPNRAEYFSKIFDSYGLGQELLIDHLGYTYYNNYATTYDLMFQHLPKGVCGPFPRHYVKGHYIPETDLTKVYGNLTQWGLKEGVYKARSAAKCQDEDSVSETFAQYKPHNSKTVKKLNDFQNFKKVKVVY